MQTRQSLTSRKKSSMVVCNCRFVGVVVGLDCVVVGVGVVVVAVVFVFVVVVVVVVLSVYVVFVCVVSVSVVVVIQACVVRFQLKDF